MKKVIMCMVIIMGLICCCSCGGYGNTELVKTTEFSSNDFRSLKLDFDDDDITVFKSENDEIILKEYMNKNKDKYYAKSSTKGTELNLTEGDRPLSNSFESYIEIYIPSNFFGHIRLHSTSGIIKCDNGLPQIKSFGLDTTSGEINISDLNCNEIKITSTSGKIRASNVKSTKTKIESTGGNTSLDNYSGIINYVGKSGKLDGQSLTGSGDFEMTGDGTVKLDYTDVTGNISVYSKNQSIALTLPKKLSFNFTALTKDGNVKTNFDHLLKVTDDNTTGIIGISPEIDIELESRNGDINVDN